MSGNKILISTVVLAALLALTVWQFNARDQEDAREPDVAVKLPKVKKDDVDEVDLSTGDKPKITLKKAESALFTASHLVTPLVPLGSSIEPEMSSIT